MIVDDFPVKGLILITGISFLFYKLASSWNSRSKSKAPSCSIPSAPYTLPLGVDLMYRAFQHMRHHNLYEWTNEILQVPGRTIELNLMGSRMVLTDEPENVKTIMSTQFSNFVKGETSHHMFQNVLGDSIFTADGQSWLNSKNLLRPHISKSRPNDLEITEKHCKELLANLKAEKGYLDVNWLFDRYQTNVAMDIFLGESPGAMDKEAERFTNAVNKLLHINSIRTVFGPIAYLCPDWLFAPQAYKDYNTYLERVASENSLPDKEIDDLKDRNTLNLRQALILDRVDTKQVRAQLVAVLVAAKDPPSITMSWMIYELARHPDVMQHLREEIFKVVGFTTPPTAAQLKQIPFLQSVIKETLRLYHPLGLNIRHVKVDTSLPTGGGPSGSEPVHLLAGERVAYSVMGLQRRPDIIGPDADQWRPSRWETWTPSSSEFIPFNMGPRVCLGRNHGMQQMEYVVVRLLQEFEQVVCTNERTPRIKVEMNTKPAEPIMCQFKERKEILI